MSNDHDTTEDAGLAPVTGERSPAGDDHLSDGTALCLSGGGYRAMTFHLGAIIRLNELGRLKGLARVSSVSGGSITAAQLGLVWNKLEFTNGVAGNLDSLVIEPILGLASVTIDRRSILAGIATPLRSIADLVAAAYDRHLYDGATLRELPGTGEGPRFVINATNVQTGKLFRFSQAYQGDYSVGLWRNPSTLLADVVAASSAFPPVLSPHRIRATGSMTP